MSDMVNKNQSQQHNEEITPKSSNGIVVLLLNIILIIAGIVALAYGIYITDSGYGYGILLIIIGVVYSFIIGPILFGGLKILKPNEALVLTLFGRYYGTLRGEGFFFVNPLTYTNI